MIITMRHEPAILIGIATVSKTNARHTYECGCVLLFDKRRHPIKLNLCNYHRVPMQCYTCKQQYWPTNTCLCEEPSIQPVHIPTSEAATHALKPVEEEQPRKRGRSRFTRYD